MLLNQNKKKGKHAMKKLIFKMFYKLSEWMERMLKVDGERWEYERAPYCGYHECGHSGKLTHSYHYEGDGYYGLHAGDWEWNFHDDIKKTSLTYKQYRPLYYLELKVMKRLWRWSQKGDRVAKVFWWLYPKCNVSNGLNTYMSTIVRKEKVVK